jgi:8-oxo-dGTP pyrophosphatase MutT (NUDIX family)
MNQESVYLRQTATIAVHEGRVCLITSRRRKRWVIPKGNIERGKTAAEIAAQEAWEEAGLAGIVNRTPIGAYYYSKSNTRFRVTVFFMHVTSVATSWPEHEERKRRWVSPAKALIHIEEPGLRVLLQNVTQAETLSLSS